MTQQDSDRQDRDRNELAHLDAECSGHSAADQYLIRKNHYELKEWGRRERARLGIRERE
jgi:hypothetical protein